MTKSLILDKVMSKLGEALSLQTTVVMLGLMLAKLLYYLYLAEIISEREIEEVCL